MFDPQFVNSLFEMKWFSQCGNPPPPLHWLATQVSSWEEAGALSSTIEWENTTLEARNQLNEFLQKNYRKQSQDWNAITTQAKSLIIFPLTEKFWHPFAASKGLGKSFIDCVQWDVLAACMENAYWSCEGLPKFFSGLLEIYRAGHFPCGWTAGEYPNGNLVIW